MKETSMEKLFDVKKMVYLSPEATEVMKEYDPK